VRPEQLMAWMEELLDKAAGYKEHGGTHTAGLFGVAGLELLVEDIGRHNTVDRIAGEALLADIDTRGKAILTSGRISSEMLVKASRLGCGIVASRTSPTELAVSLAIEANVALCGYVRRDPLVRADPADLALGRVPGVRPERPGLLRPALELRK
jgi:FdhD protein